MMDTTPSLTRLINPGLRSFILLSHIPNADLAAHVMLFLFLISDEFRFGDLYIISIYNINTLIYSNNVLYSNKVRCVF